MFVNEMCGSWYDHPFRSANFCNQVWIDTAKCSDV
ncbi:DUF3391 domain-containing protein [Candidatus Methylospira mobilis]